MIAHITEASAAALADFDAIIDTRSPAEFAQDHIPGAINLPVLDDEERARIGTIYVQDDPFLARRLGAALVSRNIARHLEGPLAGLGGGWRPLIYCWRGGQRSHAMATVLSQVGWRTTLLSGGYKAYRRGVVRLLYDGGAALPTIVLLSGGTGVGKTELLAVLKNQGAQVLDLEALAEHRGSLLGGVGGQPSQKMFESRLSAALEALDPIAPLILEAESSRIGQVTLPPILWAAMSRATSIVIQAPLAARVTRLVRLYGAVAQNGPDFAEALDRLPRHIGRQQIAELKERLAAGALDAVAQALIEQHYDPSYGRRLHGDAHAALPTISTGDGSHRELERAATSVAAAVAQLPAG